MSERYLPSTLRRTLERVIKDARIVAEEGARDAIRRLGVAEGKAPSYLAEEEKELRRRLRAHARALGDAFDRTNDTQETKHLIEATAYAHWHRMLFARFLAERGLLRNPEYDVPVTLEDCRELAEAEGLTDPWTIAERYAAQMLPAVFRVEDPVLALEIDPVHTQKLQKLVTGLDAEVFEAEDSLGWTYQFWRAAEKDAVNASGVKIGADEMPAVTQLFTEPYMVRFLLHNTLGAWWAGKVLASDPTLAKTAADEDELRDVCSLPDYRFDMLRFVRENDDGPWRPAAGSFQSWPREAKDITVLDPCCGSGHFLTEALSILAVLRRSEECLSPAEAVASALRDNLFGLEIDGRCVQIAAFAVALTAWRIGGWQLLTQPNLAWVGSPPPLPERDFVALANAEDNLAEPLATLHGLFLRAPLLGSLIEPSSGDLFESAKMQEAGRALSELLTRVRQAEPDVVEGTIAARGMSDAAAILFSKFTLAVTNPPYLGQGEFSRDLFEYISKKFSAAKADISTAFIQRMESFVSHGGSVATVTKQEWCFLPTFYKFRKEALGRNSFDLFAFLGEEAWEAYGARGPKANISCFTRTQPSKNSSHAIFDVTHIPDRLQKSDALASGEFRIVKQFDQIKNPKSRISSVGYVSGTPLSKHAHCHNGLVSGDGDRFIREQWELYPIDGDRWLLQQTSAKGDDPFSGAHRAIRWDNDFHKFIEERLDDNPGAWIRGTDAWGKKGVIISGMRYLNRGIYLGYAFDNNCSVVTAKNEEDLPAIWRFCCSESFVPLVRALNPKVSVTDNTFVQVPFEIEEWRSKVNVEEALGIPETISNDPCLWLFHGHPLPSAKGTTLQVALARMAGYRWLAETDEEIGLSAQARSWIESAAALPAGDNDGLLGVPAVAGEKPLADRLRAYLASSFGAEWSDDLERRLVAEADEAWDKKAARDGSLEAWVRDRAFRQHCALFGQRPFLWHISDGLKDGFSVFVHYHRFDQAKLRKLTFTLLGDWLARAKAEGNTLRFEKGRELQQKLEAILEGEKPYDIFVRWKSLARQPLGWDPDLDDGIRQNIRPFILAGVLAHKLDKILRVKDRGKDVASAPWYGVFKGERRNDHHTTLAEKRAAREAANRRVEASR
ncbi:Eco57I restriction-modification methylase domain-containing protein [Ruegeria arenilitoris]|uniref:Eco57I restriction-modification methylase domain-containing protein n=1 Tax=Ruegeria arenilitoris TaxID=1173585 RepID=UPI00147A2176|nr:SAM-dependent DNA methyltransferase [Ruegeria arenilitoris]